MSLSSNDNVIGKEKFNHVNTIQAYIANSIIKFNMTANR
jgi:hypothetical protein